MRMERKLRPGVRSDDVPELGADCVDGDDAYWRTYLRQDVGVVRQLYTLDQMLGGLVGRGRFARPDDRPAYEAISAMCERHQAEVRQAIEQWVNHGARVFRTPDEVAALVGRG